MPNKPTPALRTLPVLAACALLAACAAQQPATPGPAASAPAAAGGSAAVDSLAGTQSTDSMGGPMAPAPLPVAVQGQGQMVYSHGQNVGGGDGERPRHLGHASLRMEPGLYRCELNRRVTVRRIADDGRSMVISWDGKDHALDAVEARTGALRYENSKQGLMWLTIVGKSMLLDTRKGQQLANECKL